MAKNTIVTSDEWEQKELNLLESAKDDIRGKLNYALNNHDDNSDKRFKDSEDDEDDSEISWDEDYEEGEDDDFSVDDLDNLIEKVYNACYWVENLLDWVKLNNKMKSAITNIALEDKMWFGDSLMRILKVFGDNNESHVFTFNQILKLISLRLDEDYLQNFIDLKNCFTYFCADDINYILKYPFLLSNEIVWKLCKLDDINSKYAFSDTWFTFSVDELFYLRDLEITDELEAKIDAIFWVGNKNFYLNLKELPFLDKLDVDRDLIGKLCILDEFNVSLFLRDFPYIKNLDLNDKFVNTLKRLKECKVLVYSNDLYLLENFEFTEWMKKNLKYVIREQSVDGNLSCLVKPALFIAWLSRKEIDEDLSIAREIGSEYDWYVWLETFHQLPREVIEYCKENKIVSAWDVYAARIFYSLVDRKTIQDYLQRKNNFLANNKVLSDEKYYEYFWWKWKHNEYEINQWNLWLCYMYSCLQLFKNMNWFESFIQSNFIEEDDWWLVRIPLNTWKWIKVHKDEIDKKFELKYHDWKVRSMNINSYSDSLWLKVLEIAFIKKLIYNDSLATSWKGGLSDIKIIWYSYDNSWDDTGSNWKEDFSSEAIGTGWIEDPLDIQITWYWLANIEWWRTIEVVRELFWEDSVYAWRIFQTTNMYERLKKAKAPSFILDNARKSLKSSYSRSEKLFDIHKTWLVAVEIWLDDIKTDFVELNDVKIVDKLWNEVSKTKLDKLWDVVIDDKWKVSVKLFSHHAYSLEKCFIDKDWNKIVRVVNPWHTWIKFDVPFKTAQKLFAWDFWVIDINTLFK